MSYYIYGGKSLKQWADLREQPDKLTAANATYLREYKQISHEFRGWAVITYACVVHLGIENVRGLMYSIKRQRKFVDLVRDKLKYIPVTAEWQKYFKRDVTSLHKRLDFIEFTVRENIRLTEIYPWFAAVGLERIKDFAAVIRYGEDEEEKAAAAALLEEIREYNAAHPEEVTAHMASIAAEKATVERKDAERKAEAKAVKEARRAARKAENAEVREIKQNAHREPMRKRKIDRDMKYLYK